MKKVLLGLVMSLICSFVYANEFGGDSGVFMTYQTINTTSTSQVTCVPTTSIYPKRDKILGFDIVENFNGTHSERWVAVYDDTTKELSGENLGEGEALEGSWWGKTFPYPRDVENGITVMQGANTIVTIYFERG